MEKVKRKMLYLDIFSVPILVLGNEYHLGRFNVFSLYTWNRATSMSSIFSFDILQFNPNSLIF